MAEDEDLPTIYLEDFTISELVHLLGADFKYGFTNTQIMQVLICAGHPVMQDVRTRELARQYKISGRC
jgi:hypothetical protein